MRQRRSQHLRLAFSAGRGRSARVDARLLDELRDRHDPSPGACAIGADIARVIGAVIVRAACRHCQAVCRPRLPRIAPISTAGTTSQELIRPF
jgi:hypothetical protein